MYISSISSNVKFISRYALRPSRINLLNSLFFRSDPKGAVLCASLDSLSPLKVLSRGYSIVKKDNKVISAIENLSVDDELEIKFNSGSAKAKILEVLK